MKSHYSAVIFSFILMLTFQPAIALDYDFLTWHPYIHNYPGFPQDFGYLVEVQELASLDIHNLQMAFTGNKMDRAVIGGATTHDSTFYIFTLNFDFPTGEGPAIVNVRDIEEKEITDPHPLKITPDIPFCFFCCSNGTTISPIAVFAYNQSELKFYKVNYTKKRTGKDIFTLEFLFDYPLFSPQQILRIIPDVLYNPAGTATLWVLGKSGCIYHITFKTNSVTQVKNFTINITDDILCYGDDYAVTSKGYIFKLDSTSNKFVCVAQQGESALHNITKDWAVGESGTFVLHSGNVWKCYNIGEKRYQFAYLFDNHWGYGATLIDTAYKPVNFVYQNTPTQISGIIPDSLTNNINGECIHFTGQNEMSLTLVTSDTEHNNSVPCFTIHHKDTQETIILKDLDPMKYPGSPYGGVIRLKSNSNSFVVKKDTLIYTVEAEEYIHAGMNWFHWIGRQYTRSIPCANGDTISIIVGEDSVRIFFDYTSSISEIGKAISSLKIKVVQVKNSICIINPSNAVHKMCLYTPSGKLVEEYSIKNKKRITLHNTLPSGIHLLRVYSKDYSIVIPILTIK